MTNTRTTKQLSTKTHKFADGSETVTRIAVYENNVRIGTVQKVDCGDVVWFDPFRGTNGNRGDGQIITVNYKIQRKYSLDDAVAVI